MNWRTGGWFNIKKSSYQYRKSHCGDKTILRPSYLHNGISYTGKMAYLYWIRALLLNHLPYACIHTINAPTTLLFTPSIMNLFLSTQAITNLFLQLFNLNHPNKCYFSNPSQSYSLNLLIVHTQSIDFVHSIHHEFLNTIHPSLIHSIHPIHIYVFKPPIFNPLEPLRSCWTHYNLIRSYILDIYTLCLVHHSLPYSTILSNPLWSY